VSCRNSSAVHEGRPCLRSPPVTGKPSVPIVSVSGGTSTLRPSGDLLDAERFLRSLAARLCRNDQDARDLVQDTYERALRWSGRTRRGTLRAWLGTTLHNLFVDGCRASAHRPHLEPLDEGSVGAAEPEAEPAWMCLTLADIESALDELEAEFRAAYV